MKHNDLADETTATIDSDRFPCRSLDGVVIGILLGFSPDGSPLVAFSGNPGEQALAARFTTRPDASDLGCEVALLFEGGDPQRPVLIGVVRRPERRDAREMTIATVDRQQLVLSAEQEVVLRCGRASITLTRAGKVLIKGDYVSSRSSGTQRLCGASIEFT